MKKVVFKGTINGKEFNSVQEYNAEMTKALASGKTVNAQASTHTIDDDIESSECDNCDNCDKCRYNECDCPSKLSVNFTPFADFYSGGEVNLTIGTVLDDSEDLDKESEGISNFLKENYQDVLNEIDKWGVKKLEIYMTQLKSVKELMNKTIDVHDNTEDSILDKINITEKQIFELRHNLQELQKKQSHMKKARKILANVKNFYDLMICEVANKYKNLRDEAIIDKNESSGCETKVKQPQQEINLEDLKNGMIFKDGMSFQEFINKLANAFNEAVYEN